MRKFFSCIVFLGVLLTFCVPAFAGPLLFGDYELGMSKNSLLTRPGMKPGEGSMEGDLILSGVSWAGQDWTVQFGFKNDALVRVTLLGNYARERFDAVRHHLEQNGFEVLALVLDQKALDLFSLEDQKKMANSIGEFLRMVDMNILQVEVTQLGDGTAAGPQTLLVTFFFPVLNAMQGI